MKNLIYLLILFPIVSFAQITDNFSDGDFTNNPQWSGDISQFKINSYLQLQLDGTDADTSILTLETNINGAMEWDIWIKLSFSPSSNNNLRIYLQTNNYNLKSPLNGYFIKIGETGSDDSIDLYRQDSLSTIKIIDGISGNVSQTSNTVNIKITRDEMYNWKIFSDIKRRCGIYIS